MAFAAGAMLFVSIHELIPMARLYRHLGAFLGGTVLSALTWPKPAAVPVDRQRNLAAELPFPPETPDEIGLSVGFASHWAAYQNRPLPRA